MAKPIVHAHTARTPLPQEAIRSAKAAAAGTKTDFRSLLASSLSESRHNPHARNTRSSAAGAYQFTERTWLDLMRRHGAALGEGEAAARITVENGKPVVADPAARQAILDLRSDTRLAAKMAALYSDENRAALGRSLGHRPSENEVRMAYLLGAHGATKLIKAAAETPDMPADRLVPSAVRSNPGLFRSADGTVKTASEAVASLSRHFDRALHQVKSAIGTQVSDAAPLGIPSEEEVS
ncbi:MAG TPA: hypothetical protein VFA50_21160 [Stellaceae bacterium]|nr:hypothetical protein [Stellaceae bacterium]